jgi:hypothetical protein
MDALPQALAELTSLLSSYTFPIFENDNRGRPQQIGSSFIVRSDSEHYLVSAAHVLELLKTKTLYYYTAQAQIRKLNGKLMLNPWEGDRDKDPIDTGVLRLGNESHPPYPDLKKFAVQPSYLRPSDSPRDGKHYAIVGYPETKNRADLATRTVNAVAYAYRNHSLPESEYQKHKLSPREHIVLPLRPKKSFDPDGKHVHFPKPQGMSGSPIWLLFDDDASDLGPVCPIVGIGTKFRKGVGIIGTDVGIAMGMIKRLSQLAV